MREYTYFLSFRELDERFDNLIAVRHVKYITGALILILIDKKVAVFIQTRVSTYTYIYMSRTCFDIIYLITH